MRQRLQARELHQACRAGSSRCMVAAKRVDDMREHCARCSISTDRTSARTVRCADTRRLAYRDRPGKCRGSAS